MRIPALIVGLLALAGLPKAPHPDFANPGHTGGFGEPTCTACHADGEPTFDPDVLGVELVSGAAPKIVVSLRHPDMLRAGFQLAVRHPDGTQAGTLRPVSDRVVVRSKDGVEYASHSEAGSHPPGDSISWRLMWEKPARADSTWLHVSANVANGDASPLGDLIFTHQMRLR